jgi:hypothetical protein
MEVLIAFETITNAPFPKYFSTMDAFTTTRCLKSSLKSSPPLQLFPVGTNLRRSRLHLPLRRTSLLVPGDWLYFEDMGACTTAAATRFNGFGVEGMFYVNSKNILISR